MNLKKLQKFLAFAETARGFSKDRNTQVGSVILDDDFNVRATGYNGPPRGVADHEDRLSRPNKYLGWMGHAEENAIAQAARVGVSLNGCTLIVTSLHPCATCARLIIQAGIKRVLAPSVDNERWREQSEIAGQMFAEAGVEVHFYTLEG